MTTITALVDACGGIFCPNCHHVMYGRIYHDDASKYLVECLNIDCKEYGRDFIAPRQTIELTPVEKR